MENSVTQEPDTVALLAFTVSRQYTYSVLMSVKNVLQQKKCCICTKRLISIKSSTLRITGEQRGGTINKASVTSLSSAISLIPLYPLLFVSLFVFVSHCPSLSVLRLPPLCLTLSCLRASICLQSFPPSPHPPRLLLPPRFPLFPSVPSPVTPSSLPVWLEPWLVQLSITEAKPCQGRLNPEAPLSPHYLSLFYLSRSPSFNKFVPVNKPSQMTPSS